MNSRYNNIPEKEEDVVASTNCEDTNAPCSEDCGENNISSVNNNTKGNDSVKVPVESFNAIYKEVALLKDDLEKLKYKHRIFGLSNPLDIRNKRREIARKLTFINKNKYACTKK